MAGMICKQPNGLYCRVSTIVEAPTFFNASKSELASYLIDTHQLDPFSVDEWIERYVKSFEYALSQVTTLNMTQDEIDLWIKKVTEQSEIMEYC